MKVVDGDYGQAVIRETVTIKAGPTTSVEKYQYVMDRRSMKFVEDPRQFAFGNPTATIARRGRLSGQLRNGHERRTASIGATSPKRTPRYPLVLHEGRHYHADARIDVIDFTSKLEKPVAPYYRAHLEAMGLPMQVTAAQLQGQLSAAGIDVEPCARRCAAPADPGRVEAARRHARQARSPEVLLHRRRHGVHRAEDGRVGRRARPARRRGGASPT